MALANLAAKPNPLPEKRRRKTFSCISLQAAQKLFLTGPSLFKGIGFPLLESNGSSYRSADGPVRTCTLLVDAHSCTVFNCVRFQMVFGIKVHPARSPINRNELGTCVASKSRGFTEFDQVPNLRLLSTSFLALVPGVAQLSVRITGRVDVLCCCFARWLSESSDRCRTRRHAEA